MATAIFFGLPAHGHTNPTLPIVAELVRQGEHIIYYSTEEFRPTIEATGADFRAYGGTFPFNEMFFDENGFRVIRRLFQLSQRILEHLLHRMQSSCARCACSAICRSVTFESRLLINSHGLMHHFIAKVFA